MIKEKLYAIREPRKAEKKKAAAITVGCFVLGALLGVFAKWLDTLALDSTIRWHRLIEAADLNNFFSEPAVWLLAALLIAVFSASALWAALRVFLFFLAMCGAYHLCSVFFAGFDPAQYMTIWYGITLVSPLLAALCWYAKGKGAAAVILDVGIFAVFSLSCFSIGLFYVGFRGVTYLLVFLGAAAALFRSPKQTLIALPAGFILSFLLSPLWPYR